MGKNLMGIKNLLKFLNNYPGLIQDSGIDNYKGKKIAIDISILLYQVVIAIRNSGTDLTNKQGEITSHILGLFNKTIVLIKRGIIPIYVFDGVPPDIKKKTLDTRKQIRKRALKKLNTAETKEDKIKYFKRTVSISKKQMNECRDLLDLMGIPYVDAPEEADSQCAYLARMGFVDGVLTEDMDILTFGSPLIVRNLASQKKQINHISLQKILTTLNFTHEQFIDFCILLGCDYCDGMSDIKPKIIYEVYSKHHNINDTIEEFKESNYNVPKIFNYKIAKKYFQTAEVCKVSHKDLEILKPRQAELTNLLVNKHGLIKYKLQKKIERLIISYYLINKPNTNKKEIKV